MSTTDFSKYKCEWTIEHHESGEKLLVWNYMSSDGNRLSREVAVLCDWNGTVKIPVQLGRSKPVIQVKESDVQKCITDWLSIKRIWWMRMNSGSFAMPASGNQKRRFFRSARPGTADLLTVSPDACKCPCITWIEVKRLGGKQSDEQRAFQAEVESHGMAYLLADCLEDVIEAFEPKPPMEKAIETAERTVQSWPEWKRKPNIFKREV